MAGPGRYQVSVPPETEASPPSRTRPLPSRPLTMYSPGSSARQGRGGAEGQHRRFRPATSLDWSAVLAPPIRERLGLQHACVWTASRRSTSGADGNGIGKNGARCTVPVGAVTVTNTSDPDGSLVLGHPVKRLDVFPGPIAVVEPVLPPQAGDAPYPPLQAIW